jgi:ubiquinone/menaquinone biosynthesis C-methylase UbiE
MTSHDDQPMKASPLYKHLAATLAAVSFLAALSTQAAEGQATNEPPKRPDVIYVPTPQQVVDKMLQMAEVKKGDVVYDLGCGDGRIVVTAAKKYGVKAIGFDIDPERIKESLENVRTNKVEHLVTIKQQDIFTLDLTPANVVTLYLLPSLNVKLMPQLEKLKKGSRIVSHDFDMRGAKPLEKVSVNVKDNVEEDPIAAAAEHTIYKWVVPWEKEKE